MDNRLTLVISLYEEEKIQLQKLVDNCLVETDYLLAHYHSEALQQVNKRLLVLYFLNDPLYGEKQLIQREIGWLGKQMDAEVSDELIKYYEKKLQQAKVEFEKLNQNGKSTPFTNNGTLLDETLARLVDKSIKNVKLILKKQDRLFLAFNYSNNLLKLTLPFVKKHMKSRMLYEHQIISFQNLGFDLIDNETRLCLKIAGSKEYILSSLKIILSKIVFEIFYFKEFDNESYIQFCEKVKG